MKEHLTIPKLIESAKVFSEVISQKSHPDLFGISDGKAIGTYIEHSFKNYLQDRYEVKLGNSADGIDIPDENIVTDIKATSIKQPQSSCPFRNAEQKIFGLGYNLIIFVYEKTDTIAESRIDIKFCTFVRKDRTADFTITKRIREMLQDGANKEDIIAYLIDRNIPGDEIIYDNLAVDILPSLKRGDSYRSLGRSSAGSSC